MSTARRDFLKQAGLMGSIAMLGGPGAGAGNGSEQGKSPGYAGRDSIEAAPRIGRVLGLGAEARYFAGAGHHVFS